MDSLRIVLIEPFYSGSHKQWADGLKSFSDHYIEILSLPGRHWKWRMHGGAISLANQFLELDYKPDLILATSMLDLTTFLSLTRAKSYDIPVIMYMHENQINYPWSPQDRDVKYRRDNHYAFINYSSALSADQVLFNSTYHMTAFLDALPSFLKQFPDKQGKGNIEVLKEKSQVLQVGVNFEQLDACKPDKIDNNLPIILWNHRWEFDKQPEIFFETLFQLNEKEIGFNLVVLGEQNDTQPAIFEEARIKLKDRILHFGYTDSFTDYGKRLWKSDILPVTSIHDFFGVSVVEAIHCSCYPLLPNRLAYPEHVTDTFLYEEGELLQRLLEVIQEKKYMNIESVDSKIESYNWLKIIKRYDQVFERQINRKHVK